MIGAIEPSSDANSQSFYSNNTSAISSNLNDSRYLLNNNRRETRVPNIHVGKVIPNMLKSIDNTNVQVGNSLVS